VIAIIAILAAMLLPALQRARYQARKVVCVGNLDQQNKALFMLAGDNDRDLTEDGSDFNGNLIWDVTYTRTNQMMQDSGLVQQQFVCPLNPKQGSEELVNGDSMWTFGPDFGVGNFRITGYLYLFKRTNGPMAGQSVVGNEWVDKVFNMEDPSSQVLAADVIGNRNNGPWFEMTGGWHESHRSAHMYNGVQPDSASAAYVDGHVAAQSFAEVMNGGRSQSGVSGFKWWF
jgi:hypothetical protein